MTGPVSFTTPKGIAFFRLCVLKQAVSLEAVGIKTSRHNATAIAKREFGLKRNTPREKIIEVLTAEIERQTEERRGLVESELAAGRPVPPL